MRLSESTRSLQQYNGKIGDSAFLAGRFLYIIPIGPNKVDNQIWQTVSSYYMRAPILGEFDGRCESCEDKSSNIDVEIDPYGSHVCNGYPMVSELQDMTLLQSRCSTPYRDVSVSCISVLGTVFGSYKT